MVRRCALVYQTISEVLQPVAQNVLRILTVRLTRHVPIKSVVTLVLALVASAQNVLLSITVPFVAVRIDILEIHLLCASR